MFYIYIVEIRNRCLLVFLAWISTIFLSYFYKETLLFLMVKPCIIQQQSPAFYFIFTNLTDMFATYLELAYFVGHQISFFFLMYHLFIFLAPGLYYSEYKTLKFIFFLSFLGRIVAYYFFNQYILPASWYFFINYQRPLQNQPLNFYFEAKVTEYLNFYTALYYISNLQFQLCVIVYLYLKFFKGNTQIVRKSRRILYFLFFILATFITPPDIISQICLGVVLVVFYELILIFYILRKKFLKRF